MNNIKRLGLILGAASLLVSLILFAAWSLRKKSEGHLTWDPPVIKKSIQTYAYKVYGNSSLDEGRYFMSKTVFHNTGNKSVTDFSVSYKVGNYLDWTTPETLGQIPPGHTVIKCFYPQFPMKVTEIKNTTPSKLEIKIHWNDGNGPHEDVVSEDFMFRGVNEVEYTDLPAKELVTWFDNFVNTDLVAAMVTPNDPVVTEYAAAVTEKLHGAVVGAGGFKEAVEVMQGLYEYMTETGLRYAGSLGFPDKVGDVVTTVQTVRLPRDVIISNNGLCIELTLLWASVLDHLGIKSYLILIPGHAFIVAKSDGQLIPVECTAITPKAVGAKGPVDFVTAYKFASQELDKAMDQGLYKVIDFRTLQSAGIQPPELPEINVDQVKNILAQRRPMPQQRGFNNQPIRR